MVCGLLVRVLFIRHSARIDGDTLIYGDIAKNLMEKGVYGFSLREGVAQPTLIRLPGYPLFLLACFRVFGVEHYGAVMYVQAIIDLVTCLLVSLTTGKLFGRGAGVAVLWLAVLCPFSANYVAAPLTETLSLFCVAVVFFGFQRWKERGCGFSWWIAVIGAGLGFAVVLRPEQGLLAAAVLPAMGWVVWREGRGVRGISPVIATAFLVILPLVPWTLRNWETFHVFQPLAPRYATDVGETVPFGFQRWYRTWAIDFVSTEDVYWNYDGAALQVSDLPARAFDSQRQYEDTAALLEDYNETTTASDSFDRRFAELAKERIRANPLRYYVALPAMRLVNMLFRPRTETMAVALEWWKFREHWAQSVVALGFAVVNLGYFLLGGLGLWLWWRRKDVENASLMGGMVAFFVLRCALLLTLDNSEPRYTLEFFPVILVWSGAVFGRFLRGKTTVLDGAE